MSAYLIYNDDLEPVSGYLAIAVGGNPSVNAILANIWETCGDDMKDIWPKVAFRKLSLYLLNPPIVEQDVGSVITAMKEYQARLNVSRYITSSAPSPSAMAADSQAFADAQNKHFLYDGRSATGPPVTIYHPAFARLKEDLNGIDRIVLRNDLRVDLLSLTYKLCVASLKIYEKESAFVQAAVPLLRQILDANFSLGFKIHDSSQSFIAEFDAAARISLQDAGEDDPVAIYACVDFKKDLGKGGAGGVQMCYYERIGNVSCCPSILISFSGPYIRFYGAVFAEVIAIQPFTDYIYLGGDPDMEARIVYVAKVLQSVRAAACSLRNYYGQLSIKPANTNSIAHVFPCPAPVNEVDRALLTDLRFVDRFEYFGHRYKDQRGKSVVTFSRSLFRAQLGGDEREVLVKFAFRYSEVAHRLLAAHDPPLAPQLHCCMPLLGGIMVVVMDVVRGHDAIATIDHNAPLPSSTVDEVKTALETLHNAGLVHGDLRRPNIVAVERGPGRMGAMLIDFDWAACGPTSFTSPDTR
ncbi:hypothetical protein C2E23DRAFT_863651 [Lenzites betulinus]|nr:hypothetical protein C2E23DRAFT_863651 [Lenzites betulinus]